MPLSAKTKNLLDLYADLAESKDLTPHDGETIRTAIVYATAREQWGPLAALATELAERQNGVH